MHIGYGFHVSVEITNAQLIANERVKILVRKNESITKELHEVESDYEEVGMSY